MSLHAFEYVSPPDLSWVVLLILTSLHEQSSQRARNVPQSSQVQPTTVVTASEKTQLVLLWLPCPFLPLGIGWQGFVSGAPSLYGRHAFGANIHPPPGFRCIIPHLGMMRATGEHPIRDFPLHLIILLSGTSWALIPILPIPLTPSTLLLLHGFPLYPLVSREWR